MNALYRWQQQILACRQERKEADQQMWERNAAWYALWVEHNDYAQQTLMRIMPLIHAQARILEIGPGSGALTLPLAGWSESILAIEPAQGMRAMLKRNLAAAGRANVTILENPIEESLDAIQGPFDLALAVYSLYNVLPIDTVIAALTREARHVVAIMGTGDQEEWYQELYRRFRGRPPNAPPQVDYLAPVLREMNIRAEIEVLQTTCNYVYADWDSLLDQWAGRLRVGDARRNELRDALLPLVERRNGHVGIYRRRRTALVHIENKAG